jgi:phosphoribosylaminoimidazole-succinocarboxamide synthase
MSDAWIGSISQRYIELFEKVTGQTFKPENWEDARVEEAVVDCLRSLQAI